jgi:hypothetical protein
MTAVCDTDHKATTNFDFRRRDGAHDEPPSIDARAPPGGRWRSIAFLVGPAISRCAGNRLAASVAVGRSIASGVPTKTLYIVDAARGAARQMLRFHCIVERHFNLGSCASIAHRKEQSKNKGKLHHKAAPNETVHRS